MDEPGWTALSTVEHRNLQKVELEVESPHTPSGVRMTAWEHLEKELVGFLEWTALVALDISPQCLFLVLTQRQNR